ncbi:MAG: TolC family protein [Verrucomicrobiales bacterium]|nr:TolC family protein [Verrucomicrobiales bacterium]
MIRIPISLLLLVIVPLAADAEDDYLLEALRANPEVAAAYQSYLAASTRGTQVRALDEPTLSYSEFLTSVQTRTGPQERTYAISQSFPWPGVLKLRERVADANARVSFYRYEVKRRQVIEKVGLARIEYAYLKRATDRAAENLGLLEQIKPVVQEKVRAGGSLATSLRLDVELAVADQEVDTLRDQRPGLDAQLKVLLGRDPGGDPLPWPDLPSQPPALMPLGSIRSELKAHHPMIRMAEAGIQTAKEGEALAGKNGLPAFTVGANTIDIGNGGETASSVMLGVKLPLRREKYRAGREEAAALTAAAGASLEATEQALLADAVKLYAAQQEAVGRWQNYSSKLIPSANQAVDLTREDFRNDKASLTDLIESERILLDLRLLQARALADAHKAAWQIRALTETLSESSK